MKTLVWVEHDNKNLADATLAAVTAAGKLGEVHLLVAGATEGRTFGVLGEPRVNVPELNASLGAG